MFVVLFLVLAALAIACVSSQNNTCIFTPSNVAWQLDLSMMVGKTLQVKQAEYYYYYTPCYDGLNCAELEETVMAIQRKETHGRLECIAGLASWNASVMPTYSFYAGSFRFEFNNGDICPSTGLPRQLVVFYVCDYEIDPYMVAYAFEDKEDPCKYVMSIRTKYACSAPPNTACQYTDQSGNYSLDLGQFSGDLMTYDDNVTNTTYLYTPCMNSLNCTNAKSNEVTYAVMADIVNISDSSQCYQYLSVFDDGINKPLYNSEAGVWSFHWFNGQNCGEGNPGVEWISHFACDANVSDHVVLGAGEFGPCKWDMVIATSAACVGNMTVSPLLLDSRLETDIDFKQFRHNLAAL